MKAAFAFSLLIVIIIASSQCNPSDRIRRQGWSRDPTGLSPSTSSTTPPPNPNDPNGTTTTTASPQFRNCAARCASTPQYNPVCGSNRVTYDNVGKLNCARSCGLAVTLSRLGAC